MIENSVKKLPVEPRFTSLSPLEVVFKRGQRYLKRKEKWGTILYDFKRDLFLANARQINRDIKSEAPLAVYWLIVAPCNLRCIHCYGNVEEFPKESLSETDQHKVADKIIESSAMRVTIAGGEPLLRKDTPQIIEKLADNIISIILGTNGTFLHQSIMTSVKRATLTGISLDSFDEKINNSIRVSRAKSGNAYQETLKAIDLCVKNEVRLKILTCLNKYNYRDIEPIADLIYSRGVRTWGLSWTLFAGRAKSIYSNHMPQDMNSVEAQIEKVKEKYSDLTIRYSNRSDPTQNNRFSCLVFPNGRIFTEDMVSGAKVPFGSLLDSSFSTSWTESNFNIKQHFKRWMGSRLISHFGGANA